MSEDLIKRSDAIALIKPMVGEFTDNGFMVDYESVLSILENIPSADRPQGKWSIDSVDEIELSYGGTAYEPVYKCSHCGRTTESYVRFDKPLMPEDADFPNFCGWCGAQMKGADDDMH